MYRISDIFNVDNFMELLIYIKINKYIKIHEFIVISQVI